MKSIRDWFFLGVILGAIAGVLACLLWQSMSGYGIGCVRAMGGLN